MNRRRALALLGGLGLSSCRKREVEVRHEGVFFGIPVHLDFRNLDDARAQKTADEVFAYARPFEAIFSLWDSESELSILNRDGVLKNPSAPLIALFEKAGELHQETEGLFDPTIRSYLEWVKGEYAAGRTPNAAEAERRRKLVDFSVVEFSAKEVRLPAGFSLDLNALVQGYVTDRVAEFLADKCDSVLVNFGEFRVVGARAWEVEVEQETILISRALAVSSGAGERLSAAGAANHLMNPDTGESPEPQKIVAVEADEAWLADGLATVVSVGGKVPDAYHGVKLHRF